MRDETGDDMSAVATISGTTNQTSSPSTTNFSLPGAVGSSVMTLSDNTASVSHN